MTAALTTGIDRTLASIDATLAIIETIVDKLATIAADLEETRERIIERSGAPVPVPYEPTRERITLGR